VDAHRLAEERSLALHEVIASRIADDPRIVERAIGRVQGWLKDGSVHRAYATSWLEILGTSPEELRRALVERSERACALRQVTPFAFVVPPRERWAIWREVRARFEAPPASPSG
jgi:hypothetical protein